ncbi:hypothetical protein VKT23_000318 [Stygiomarasmius scandens]|uniref:Protein kinase domain-containing protein n=1 Tax=Marasmiellus scandens TaxID=2682957 RepID=A0ABR1K3R2_9AGAR
MTTEFRQLKYYLFTKGNDPQPKSSLPAQPTDEISLVAERIRKELNIKSDITLFKTEDLPILPRSDVRNRVQTWLEQHLEEELDLNAYYEVGEFWPTGGDWSLPKKYDLVAVDSSALEDLKVIHAFPDIGRSRLPAIDGHRSLLGRFGSAPSPSVGCTDLKTTYDGTKSFICAGRPAQRYGPPNALFDYRLARLSHEIRNLDVSELSPGILGIAHELLVASADFYGSEQEREDVIYKILMKIFPNGTRQTCVNGKHWSLSLIFELKNQRGNGGDPTTQAVLDYMAILADVELSGAFRTRSNSPCVSLGFAGSQLTVSTMICTDAVHVEELYCEDLHGGFHVDKRVTSVACTLQAVKNAFEGLELFYKQFEGDHSPSDGSYLLPRPVHAESHVDLVKSLGLRFLYKLSHKGGQVGNTSTERQDNMNHAVYVALGDDVHIPSKEVVIKFALKYNVEAHEALAKIGLAPELYHHCPVLGGCVMIVMEKITGTMAWTLEKAGTKMPWSVYADVERAVQHLHGMDIVFGDLRMPNIMVRELVHRAVLIDFDWAAKEGEGRYPATIIPDSVSHGWASGVERCGLMKKEHDWHMLKALKGACEEA